ncbi:MAG: ferritin-like domain-containing protein [Alphaproteobacteria bacterium]|nr:ferritin-like domain-containing protein [Alphaproteobacteria bacterium]MBU1514678.1 ferritin-like domain-containing protein [Alphaproteobacteria bacterium]MBU2093537.1 ferritin-like domain-containing protein [Alphaproteobacteria bacterium]MBU2149451.1 ferritin-like domain-containing protein [Alphaproteobacteria bacterium]MBU2305506.1 ferritin-like domain-containing protein [Alphaproteobacteria bacterium]
MAADGNITKDIIYDAVAPDDFESMLELDRYGNRSTAFDKIISATHDHFWDPLDTRYIDFSEPFDMENEMLLPEDMVVSLQTKYVSDRLSDRKDRVRFVNQFALRSFSSILHGEQGALNLSASLCHVLKDQGAQEYAANQTREEARHVTAFAKYIKARWGKPVECGPTLKALLVDIIGSPEVYKKIIGMQMLVEGLAMGAFATFFKVSNDPLCKKLMQLVMTDEAFHHKFGKIWADRTIPHLSEKEHEIIELWAAQCFQTLLFNLVGPTQQRSLYEEFGLDPDVVIAELATIITDETRREGMKEQANIFRVLVKTLLNAGIITERTRAFYAMYVDIDELKAEGDTMVGDAIAEEGIRYLQEINFADKAKEILIAAE